MGNPYQSDINRVDRELSRVRGNFRRMKWEERASFLHLHGRGAVSVRRQSARELADYAETTADLEDRHASEFIMMEDAMLEDYFTRLASGAERFDDPNMIRSMAMQATIAYAAKRGLPDSSSIWEVYRGVLAKHQLLPLAQPPRISPARPDSGVPIGWMILTFILIVVVILVVA